MGGATTATTLGIMLLAGCAGRQAGGDWLPATEPERSERLEAHLRGLDVAMWEIGYRYTELFFAADSGNWAYATYQADKIRQALELAVERRPAREASARATFLPALGRVDAAVEAEDPEAFATAFEGLRAGCNACHVAEDVGAFVVGVPTAPRSSIRVE